MIGVATKEAPLGDVEAPLEYSTVIGGTKDSWGWDLNLNQLHHDNHGEMYPNLVRHESMRNHRKPNPNLVNRDDLFGQSDSIKMVLDMDAGTLSFMADGKYLGQAFDGLTGVTVCAVVCTSGNLGPHQQLANISYASLSSKSGFFVTCRP